MTILETIATFAAVISPFMLSTQVYKIYKRKSAGDISIATFSVTFISGLIMLFYGIEIGAKPIIISTSIGSFFVALILIGWFLYGRNNHKK